MRVEYKALNFKADDVNTGARTFAGYASTFDADLGNDIISKGAFNKTLKERGDRVKILWQHADPIGKPTSMNTDSKGLFVEGKISKTRLGDEAVELMNDGVIDQMSIGFSIPAGKSERDSKGMRLINEVKLFEFSLVTFPMNENAFVTSIKSVKDAIRCGNYDHTELKELADALAELNALLKNEPPKNTQIGTQPQELDALQKALKNFGL
jgi:HK97 family phage prohead protease